MQFFSNTTLENEVRRTKTGMNLNAFGMQMPGRTFNPEKYKFGYQKQLKDDEIYGEGNSYAFEYRMQDPRTGRFWSVDPLFKKYPELTPYQFASNNPVWMIEIEGLEGSASTSPSQDIKNDKTGLTTGTTSATDNATTNTKIQDPKNLNFKYTTNNPATPTSIAPTPVNFTPPSSTTLPPVPMPTGSDQGVIKPTEGVKLAESWLNEPPKSIGDASLKLLGNAAYSIINSPVILLTGSSIGGSSQEFSGKMSAFIDVAPGLLSFGLTKTNQVTKLTNEGLAGYNKFVSANQGILSGRSGLSISPQTQVGKLFQYNKIQDAAITTWGSIGQGLGVVNGVTK